MPEYEYKCECEHEWSIFQSMEDYSNNKDIACPECKSKNIRRIYNIIYLPDQKDMNSYAQKEFERRDKARAKAEESNGRKKVF